MPRFVINRLNPLAGVALLALAALAGCGRPTFPVSGKVTFEGQPLAGGGSIRFVPLDDQGRESGGEIGTDGTYFMRTLTENDGSFPGEYRVEITQNQVLQPAVRAPVEITGDGEPPAAPVISPEVRVPANTVIPPIYSGASSPLRVTIAARENVGVDLELKRQP
ncbi:MAG: hypothetical protein SFU86_14155 [Pirellulaceae bacterium]|nr:hypothetical protein [Pirellulaceae bacterium]